MSMDPLILDIAKEQETYNTLANHYIHWHMLITLIIIDKQILSKCPPQVYDILTSKASMNSPLSGFYELL